MRASATMPDPLNPPVFFGANLQGSGVEHLMLVWYVRGGIGAQYSQDYNVLLELANV